jgi:hypothetical protein
MTNNLGRTIGVSIVGLGLLALVISAPAGDQPSAETGRPSPGQDWTAPGRAPDPFAGGEAAPTQAPGDDIADQMRAQTGDRLPSPAGTADAVTDRWGSASQRAAKAIIEKYGQPDEVSDSRLVWHNTGAFIKTVVYKDALEHNFPAPHADVLEQFVEYSVPLDKYDDLARLDGSLHADRTAGTLSARGPDERDNFIALNLAHEVVEGKRSVDGARAAYAQTVQLTLAGKSSPYTQGLLFKTRGRGTPDPDRAAISGSREEARSEP